MTMSANPASPELSAPPLFPLPLEPLLAPIPGDNPAGEWLRYEGTYDAIQAARQEDDSSLPQGIWEAELRKADWWEVARLCEEALSHRSKDLQIAIWLVEASLHIQGMAGLVEGLWFLHRLCDIYWETLFPELKADEPEYRSAPLDWMARQFAVLLRLAPLTPPVEALGHPLSLADWERLEPVGKPGADKGFNRDKFLQATAASPSSFYQTLAAQVDAASVELRQFEAAIDQRFRVQDAPSLAPLRQVLTALQALITRILRERGELPAATGPAGQNLVETGPAAGGTAASRSTITSREEAYRQIREAAYYLLHTEPHSPVPYLALRAVAWGNLNLSELLEELVPDANSIAYIRAFLALDQVTYRPPSGGTE
jgi:type VI secretion system protein ImpA